MRASASCVSHVRSGDGILHWRKTAGPALTGYSHCSVAALDSWLPTLLVREGTGHETWMAPALGPARNGEDPLDPRKSKFAARRGRYRVQGRL